MDGIINLDKPAAVSSAAAVARVKRGLPRGVKVGHAGTLDPFATGVLVLLVGKATRMAERFMSEPKQYEATVKLGATTETLDPESAEMVTAGAVAPGLERVEAALRQFVGEIRQAPPVFSALKIGGRPAYKLARKGESVRLEPRPVRIYGIELLGYEWPSLRLRIDCGRGTYIRSLAGDIGEALGVAGYLTALRRTRVGPCWIADAVALDVVQAEGVERYLRAP